MFMLWWCCVCADGLKLAVGVGSRVLLYNTADGDLITSLKGKAHTHTLPFVCTMGPLSFVQVSPSFVRPSLRPPPCLAFNSTHTPASPA